jgi:hypothetical protein
VKKVEEVEDIVLPEIAYKEYLEKREFKEKLDEIHTTQFTGDDKEEESKTNEKDKKTLLKQMISYISTFQQNEGLFLDYQKALDQFKHLQTRQFLVLTLSKADPMLLKSLLSQKNKLADFIKLTFNEAQVKKKDCNDKEGVKAIKKVVCNILAESKKSLPLFAGWFLREHILIPLEDLIKIIDDKKKVKSIQELFKNEDDVVKLIHPQLMVQILKIYIKEFQDELFSEENIIPNIINGCLVLQYLLFDDRSSGILNRLNKTVLRLLHLVG